jgi:hypothetical protein
MLSIKSNFIIKAVFAVLTSAIFSISNANAGTWTYTASGTINQGYDYFGIFGAVGDLTGTSFSQSITVDPNMLPVGYSDANTITGNGSILGGSATSTVTVNGVTKIFALDLLQPSYTDFALRNWLTAGYVNAGDISSLSIQGNTSSGNYLMSQNQTQSLLNPFMSSVSFNQDWSYNIPTTGTSAISIFNYGIANLGQFTAFTGTTSLISFTVSAVPEADTYAMMLAGFGLIGFMARRKKTS